MKSLIKIFSVFTPQEMRYCMFLIVAMILGAILEAVGIGAILPLISLMGQSDFLTRHADVAMLAERIGIGNHTELIVSLALFLVAFYILKNVYLAWQLRLQINFSLSNQIHFSKELMANYLSKPYLFHLNHNTATLLRNVKELVTAFCIWLMLVVTDPFTALVVAGTMGGLIYALLRSFRRSVAKVAQTQNQYAARYIQSVNQGLGAIKETKVMRKEMFFLQEFADNYEQYGMAYRNFIFLNQFPRMIIETLVVCALLLLIIGKILLGDAPMDIVPILGVLALAAFRLMPSANRIVALSTSIKFWMPLFEELYRELLAIKARKIHCRPLALEASPPPVSFQEKICVKGIRFHYPSIEEDVI